MAIIHRRTQQPVRVTRIDAADGPLVIFAAMFESLCQDLAQMRRAGMWSENPKEALMHPRINDLLHDEGPITARTVVNEYLSKGLKQLSLLIDTASGGKVKIGQSCAIRWAKEMSEQPSNSKRARL